MDIKDIKEQEKAGLEDEDGLFDFTSIRQTVDLKSHIKSGDLENLLPCTPSYLLHQSDETCLSQDDLQECSNFLKLVFKTKVLIL